MDSNYNFIYYQQLDQLAIESLKNFYICTQQVWKNMYDIQIISVKKMFGIDLLDTKKTKLTQYVDYAKKIKDFEIRLPDWFILSSGTEQQKIYPCYQPDFDPFPILLIDMFCPRDKTMIVCHLSQTMTRNGMHVSDILTRNLFKIFGNPLGLTYIRDFSSSPEYCYMIRDHYAAYYEHLKFGLLEENLKRIILISSRQFLFLIKILKENKDYLTEEIMMINKERGLKIKSILNKNKDMRNIFQKLWPNLKIIILAKNGNMRIATERIKLYTGDNVKLYCPVYSLPEVTIGYDIDNDNTYIVDPRKAYFEFIPLDSNYLDYLKNSNSNITDLKTKSIRNLEKNKFYNIVISSIATDLHRYITGEIIKVVDYVNGSPKIEIICRDSELTYEKDTIITTHQIESILIKHFKLVDYCYRKLNGVLKLYMELEKECYMDSDIKEDIKDIKIYQIFSGIINNLEIRIVKSGTFEIMYNSRYNEYIDPSLIQLSKVLDDTFDIEIIRENILFLF
jgi:hypothetical protein